MNLQIDVISEWMRFSKMDLDAANTLNTVTYPKPLEIVCFHCQQSAEKSLKAFLLTNEFSPPKTHDLDELYKMCAYFEQEFREIEKYCSRLSPFGVAVRYPYGVELCESDATRALNYAQIIYDKVDSLIKENMLMKQSPQNSLPDDEESHLKEPSSETTKSNLEIAQELASTKHNVTHVSGAITGKTYEGTVEDKAHGYVFLKTGKSEITLLKESNIRISPKLGEHVRIGGDFGKGREVSKPNENTLSR